MPAQQGQTDQVLKVKLASEMLTARWLDGEVAANGEAGLEVATRFVGHGAPIKAAIKDAEGNAAGSLEGKVLQNWFRARFRPDPKAAGKTLFFEAELPKHGLKLSGGGLRVFPAVEFSALRFTDAKGGALAEIQEGKTAICEAKVKGLEDGAKVNVTVSLRLRKDDPHGASFVDAEAPVKGGTVALAIDPRIKVALESIRIQQELDREGGKYHQPEFLFSCRARGVTAVSGPAKAVQTLTLRFEEGPGHAGSLEGKSVTIVAPDGSKQDKPIPKDGRIDIPKTQPGRYKVKGEVVKQLSPKPKSTPPGETTPLTKDAKMKLVKFIATFEGGKGDKAYRAMNLDYEFEGRWDLPKGWYKAGKDGKKAARPDSQNKKVRVSKYFDTPGHVGLSYGIIQFTQQGPLGELLSRMHKKDSAAFEKTFGEHHAKLLEITGKTGDAAKAEEEVFDNLGASMGKKQVSRKPSVQPVGGAELWQPYWTAKFKAAGGVPAFQECQEEMALEKYLDPLVAKAKKAKLKRISEKSLALLYDRSVNYGPGYAAGQVVKLAAHGDERKFWRKSIDAQSDFVKARMEAIHDAADLSWDLVFDLE